MSLLALVTTKEKLLLPKPMCSQHQPNCPPHRFSYREVCLFGALYVIAIGNGGTKPNISSLGAEQFDDFELKEKKQKLSFFNWWMFSVFFGTFLATTLMVWIQSGKGFGTGYSIQALLMVVGLIFFLVGTQFYRHKKPAGSAFTKIARVLVSASRKRNVKIPQNHEHLHELSLEEYTRIQKTRVQHTNTLRYQSMNLIYMYTMCLLGACFRFLDKAAVKTTTGENVNSPWILCTVTEVEETKQMMKMIPILLSTILPSTFFGAVQTLFIKQGTTLDRKLLPHLNPIPPSTLKCMIQIFVLASIIPYDRLFVPYMRRLTRNPRGITMLTRMGIGMALYVAIAVTCYFAEVKRMKVIKETGIYDAKQGLPLSFFILLPQFALVGIADTFLEVAKMDFFFDQAPTGMKSLGTSYYTTSMGIGCFLNSFILRIIENITDNNGKAGWVTDNLNTGHLDYYYAFWIILTAANFIFFLVVANMYVYNVDTEKSKKIDTEIVEMVDEH